MASTPSPLVTRRDRDVFEALAHCPLTAGQLLKLSSTFAYPFTNERKVRERLQLLAGSGRVRRWRYVAIAGRGSPAYYTLAREGYRLLGGADAEPPTKQALGPIGLAHQPHTYALAEFLVHTFVAAHRLGVTIRNFTPENGVTLSDGDVGFVYPDSGWQFVLPAGQELTYFLELDKGSERIKSDKDALHWQGKIRTYEAVQDRTATRFRVLVVGTGTLMRVDHILQAAADNATNPWRSLFLGTTLAGYLAEAEPLTTACFRDHSGRAVGLVPPLLSQSVESVPSQASAGVVASAPCP